MDEATRIDIERIIDLYIAQGLKERPPDVESGSWKPTPFEVLRQEPKAFERLLLGAERKGGKKPAKVVHDGTILLPGAGEGRRGAYLNRLGYHVIAVENNHALIDEAERMRDLLADAGLVGRKDFRTLQGDFLDDNLYHPNGLRFEDFKRIFAYLKPFNLDNLLRKVERQSPQGTELFFLRQVDLRESQTDLSYIGSATIVAGRPTAHYELRMYKKA